jgi:CHASE3 domain sensor protein
MNAALTQTIQIALGPVFLLVAVGGLLNVITGRLARVVDRSRDLMDKHGVTTGDAHARIVRELRIVDRRMDIINWSIALCVACGIVVCLMVAMLFLMGSGQQELATPISASFILAMLFLLGALILFLIEVRLAIRTIHVPQELLEQ